MKFTDFLDNMQVDQEASFAPDELKIETKPIYKSKKKIKSDLLATETGKDLLYRFKSKGSKKNNYIISDNNITPAMLLKLFKSKQRTILQIGGALPTFAYNMKAIYLYIPQLVYTNKTTTLKLIPNEYNNIIIEFTPKDTNAVLNLIANSYTTIITEFILKGGVLYDPKGVRKISDICNTESVPSAINILTQLPLPKRSSIYSNLLLEFIYPEGTNKTEITNLYNYLANTKYKYHYFNAIAKTNILDYYTFFDPLINDCKLLHHNNSKYFVYSNNYQYHFRNSESYDDCYKVIKAYIDTETNIVPEQNTMIYIGKNSWQINQFLDQPATSIFHVPERNTIVLNTMAEINRYQIRTSAAQFLVHDNPYAAYFILYNRGIINETHPGSTIFKSLLDKYKKLELLCLDPELISVDGIAGILKIDTITINNIKDVQKDKSKIYAIPVWVHSMDTLAITYRDVSKMHNISTSKLLELLSKSKDDHSKIDHNKVGCNRLYQNILSDITDKKLPDTFTNIIGTNGLNQEQLNLFIPNIFTMEKIDD